MRRSDEDVVKKRRDERKDNTTLIEKIVSKYNIPLMIGTRGSDPQVVLQVWGNAKKQNWSVGQKANDHPF